VRRCDNATILANFNKNLTIMMNFWPAADRFWGKGFDKKGLPYTVLYDNIEVYSWNSKTDEFTSLFNETFDAVPYNGTVPTPSSGNGTGDSGNSSDTGDSGNSGDNSTDGTTGLFIIAG